jgi:AhpD family alkylhydroperoxidase
MASAIAKASESTLAAGAALGELVPIAVAVAAGCEPCAERLVKTALERGVPGPLVARTLRIIAGMRSRDCFSRAVGPEAIARMARPLEAGQRMLGSVKAIRNAAASPGGKAHHHEDHRGA